MCLKNAWLNNDNEHFDVQIVNEENVECMKVNKEWSLKAYLIFNKYFVII